MPFSIKISMFLVMLSGSAMAVEEPPYEVVQDHETFEIRRYEPMIVAETEVEGDFDEVGNDAFRTLAGYIFGDNEENLEIEMTAPVNQVPLSDEVRGGTTTTTLVSSSDSEGSGKYLVTFVMPSEFTMETLPKPEDEEVTLREVAEKYMAAKRYSGSWGRKKYERHESVLLESLTEAGYEVRGEPIFARYNDPFTLPFLRRNEVLVEVEPLADETPSP